MAPAALIGAAIVGFIGLNLFGFAGAIGGIVVGGLVGAIVGGSIASRKAAPKPPSGVAGSTTNAQAVADTPAWIASASALTQRVYSLERRLTSLEPRLLRIERALGIERSASEAAAEAAAMAPQAATAPIAAPSVAAASATAASAAAAVHDAMPRMPATVQPGASANLPAAEASAETFAWQADGTRRAEPRADLAAGSAPPGVPPPPVEPARPNPIWAWITGGNPLAKIGIVLLFIGVGFALKLTVENVYVPVTVRVAFVALGGVALLVFGWRLRDSHPAFAMALQGGGVGVLYLTVFGALRLYSMLPPIAAFALLFWISATSSWLAIRQDALALAALSVAGGFLAPILTSTNTGNHVLLFSYYALLNAGIFGIAWFKAWRLLNLLGFAFTFVIGTLWGVTRYRPENFATTEPFLILFFLFYVGIAVLYALRRSVEVKSYVDGALVFGTPLVAAGLQSALVHDIEYAMAWSALAMSALYLLLTRVLWGRHGEGLRLLAETFLALGVLFATLAIPLGLDPRWTSAAWALEGAAAIWVGLRQQRRAVRAFGLVLQFGAGIAFIHGISLWASAAKPVAIPILNSVYMGSVFVSLAGLYTAWLYQQRQTDATETERRVIPLIFAWGMAWWLFAGWREISRWFEQDARLPAMVGLLTATAVVFALLERRLRWPIARIPALGLLPVLIAIVIATIADRWVGQQHLLANGGWLAWPLAVAAVVWMLRRLDQPDAAEHASVVSLDYFHAGLLWLVLLLVSHELAWIGRQVGYAHGAWAVVPWGLVPAIGLALVCALAAGSSWPIGAHRRGYIAVGGIPVIVVLILWTLVANFSGDGNPAPLPYLPIANPLDLTQAVVFVAAATWFVQIRRDPPSFLSQLPAHAIPVLFALLVFYWINMMVLRTIHFWFDVPYTPYGLWRSTLVQAALSLLWSALALATMVFANRRKIRAPWIAGAALLGIVIAKLFVVDLSQVGTVARIVSFIGVGLLVLVIGYLAPVPQQRRENVT